MAHALRLARAAARRLEVPVGAVAVLRGQVLAAASNRVERRQDATAHAELLVLRLTSRRLRSWRLQGVTLYSTLEPCPMCAGAALLARVERVVYAADDPRKGAYRSAYDVLGHPAGNHHPLVEGGCRSGAAAGLLQGFFADRRSSATGGTAPDAAATRRG
ncbi:MAG: nucleoside deaminase [Candidatus Dormibacteria bacterium]